MHSFLVFVEQHATLSRMNIFVEDGQHRLMANFFVPDSDVEIEWENPFNLNENNAFREVQFVWAEDEANAKLVATAIARQQPGKRVYITKVQGAAVCPPGEVSFQSVTEKGILPA